MNEAELKAAICTLESYWRTIGQWDQKPDPDACQTLNNVRAQAESLRYRIFDALHKLYQKD